MPNLPRYFLIASLFHALVAYIVTLLIAVPNLQIPKVISGGSAGMWFTVGYVMYLTVGAIGNAGFSYLWKAIGDIGSVRKALAYAHFVIFNIGLVGTTYLLMYAGYNAGYMMHVAGAKVGTIHEFLVVFVEPIGAFVILSALGAIVGVAILIEGARKLSS